MVFVNVLILTAVNFNYVLVMGSVNAKIVYAMMDLYVEMDRIFQKNNNVSVMRIYVKKIMELVRY